MIVPLNEYDFLKARGGRARQQRSRCLWQDPSDLRPVRERVYRWANLMRSLGVKKGERVAMLSQNCHRVLEAFFGTPLLGSILMPLNFRLVSDDFLYILNHGGAKVVIVEEGLEHLVDPIRDRLETIEQFIVARDDPKASTDEWMDYETLLAGSLRRTARAGRDRRKRAFSAALHVGHHGPPERRDADAPQSLHQRHELDLRVRDKRADVYLHTLAQFHCNGWGMPYAATGMGGTHVIIKKFEPAAFFDLVTREQVTFACHAADHDKHGFEPPA